MATKYSKYYLESQQMLQADAREDAMDRQQAAQAKAAFSQIGSAIAKGVELGAQNQLDAEFAEKHGFTEVDQSDVKFMDRKRGLEKEYEIGTGQNRAVVPMHQLRTWRTAEGDVDPLTQVYDFGEIDKETLKNLSLEEKIHADQFYGKVKSKFSSPLEVGVTPDGGNIDFEGGDSLADQFLTGDSGFSLYDQYEMGDTTRDAIGANVDKSKRLNLQEKFLKADVERKDLKERWDKLIDEGPQEMLPFKQFTSNEKAYTELTTSEDLNIPSSDANATLESLGVIPREELKLRGTGRYGYGQDLKQDVYGAHTDLNTDADIGNVIRDRLYNNPELMDQYGTTLKWNKNLKQFTDVPDLETLYSSVYGDPKGTNEGFVSKDQHEFYQSIISEYENQEEAALWAEVDEMEAKQYKEDEKKASKLRKYYDSEKGRKELDDLTKKLAQQQYSDAIKKETYTGDDYNLAKDWEKGIPSWLKDSQVTVDSEPDQSNTGVSYDKGKEYKNKIIFDMFGADSEDFYDMNDFKNFINEDLGDWEGYFPKNIETGMPKYELGNSAVDDYNLAALDRNDSNYLYKDSEGITKEELDEDPLFEGRYLDAKPGDKDTFIAYIQGERSHVTPEEFYLLTHPNLNRQEVEDNIVRTAKENLKGSPIPRDGETGLKHYQQGGLGVVGSALSGSATAILGMKAAGTASAGAIAAIPGLGWAAMALMVLDWISGANKAAKKYKKQKRKLKGQMRGHRNLMATTASENVQKGIGKIENRFNKNLQGMARQFGSTSQDLQSKVGQAWKKTKGLYTSSVENMKEKAMADLSSEYVTKRDALMVDKENAYDKYISGVRNEMDNYEMQLDKMYSDWKFARDHDSTWENLF